jgi:epoxyqueuosine reductase
MKERLHALLRWIETETGSRVSGRPYVDTGPVLERDLARLAGLGWFGKNTMLINPRRGSFLFLGALFVDLALEADPPFPEEHCGTCRRCIDACPTAAIAGEGVLDATRCISYLTIEKRGAIPTEWRKSIGTLVYGCDICQDVCPWNVRFAREATDPDLTTGSLEASPDPVALLRMDVAAFQRRFGGTAVTRTGRQGLSRNAAIALGNRGEHGDVTALAASLTAEPDPVVRAHVAWALGAIGTADALDALRSRAPEERETMVLNEIDLALEGRGSRLEAREGMKTEGRLTSLKPRAQPASLHLHQVRFAEASALQTRARSRLPPCALRSALANWPVTCLTTFVTSRAGWSSCLEGPIHVRRPE